MLMMIIVLIAMTECMYVCTFVGIALKVVCVVSKNVANLITRPTIYVY